MKRLVILASGSGTNAENIITYFKEHDRIAVAEVLSNKPGAKVLDRAEKYGIPHRSFDRSELNDPNGLLRYLKERADFIILAGFLWKVPEAIVAAFPNRIINIHPALLPNYGGKGMYGMHVHEAVVENREEQSGITIHYVNEHYDEGAIIFQATVALSYPISPEEVAAKIHKLEYAHFPKVIENVVLNS
jgi:phosphoribosylglycinamide formyltransferase-1